MKETDTATLQPIIIIMHLMYYLDANGKRVYTLKVRSIWAVMMCW